MKKSQAGQVKLSVNRKYIYLVGKFDGQSTPNTIARDEEIVKREPS